MMDIEFLRKNQIPDAGAAESFASTPARLYFLEESYIRMTAAAAGVPARETDAAAAMAGRIQSHFEERQLLWHCYRTMYMLPEFSGFPEDHIDLFGHDSGLVWLLLAFSLFQHCKERMEREHLPVELASGAMKRIGTLLNMRAVLYPGELGVRPNILPFLMNYRNRVCFRLGRFDFMLQKGGRELPEFFQGQNGREDVMLCRTGWRIAPSGYLAPQDDTRIPQEELKVEGDWATGRKIDPVSGKATAETVTLDSKNYKRLFPEGETFYVLALHIPAGGGMTMERCCESFRMAREFFPRYYPDYPIAAITCVSWILNPVWRNYLPESNLAAFMNRLQLFPFRPVEKSGLRFVFGREDGEPENYPADNSMRRAMLKAWRNGELRSGGMVLPWDKTGQFQAERSMSGRHA